MIFSKSTLAVLKNFAAINPNLYLKPGNLILTRSVAASVYGEFQLPAGEESDLDVALYDLNAFLNIVSISGENTEVSQKSQAELKIKGQRSEINWPAAEPSTIVYPKNQIKFPNAKYEFNLSSDDFTQIMRIARSLGANVLSITNELDRVIINCYNKVTDPKLERPLGSYDVAEYTDTANFNFIIDMKNNMNLISDNYRVMLWAEGDKFAVKFKGDVVTYVISVEDTSSHEF